MTTKPAHKGRPTIDPHGDTKALTVRLSATVKAEMDAAAVRNGRSVSQEINARLSGTSEKPRSQVLALIAAFEDRIRVYYGSDYRFPDASAALIAGLDELLPALLGKSGQPADLLAPEMGVQVAKLTQHWITTSPDEEAAALRTSFLPKGAKKP